jgi:ABC-type lipoprotein export system ATPase subunit
MRRWRRREAGWATGIATHDPAVVAMADRVLDLDAAG